MPRTDRANGRGRNAARTADRDRPVGYYRAPPGRRVARRGLWHLHGQPSLGYPVTVAGFASNPATRTRPLGMTMQTRTLGRTGLTLSELGFGAVEIGMDYGIRVAGRPNQPTPQEAVLLLRRALELGVNVIDTARGYGESERIIGQAVGGQRDAVVLMTKVSIPDPAACGQDLQRSLGDSLETSLSLLRTDFVDVLSIHSATRPMLDKGEVVGVLDRLRTAGRTRFLGVTVYHEDEALAALDDPRIDVIQIAYSMLDASMDRRVIPLAVKRGVGVVVRSVLHRGVLTTKGAHGSAAERRLHSAALDFDFLFDAQTRSLPHAAIRFALSHPGVGCVLLGMDRLEQVEHNLGFGLIPPYSDAQLRRVREAPPADPWDVLPSPADKPEKE